MRLHLLVGIGALGAWVVFVVSTAPAATAETLKIAVTAKYAYPEYVTVKCNDTRNETCFGGLSINVFRLIWKNLNNSGDYQFIPYFGDYDSLVKLVSNKTFDLVAGDTSIVAKRCDYIEYSRPYTETGARMVVLERSEQGRAWIFVKPFTASLWGVTGIIFLYNGLIVWLIETSESEQKRSFVNSFNLIWLVATTLFPINGQKVNSNLSKMALVVWLFVALVLTQSYAANLTSMLTVRQLRPSVVDMESLLNGKAKVGCDKGSFMSKYLEDVVGFNSSRIETLDWYDYASALSNGTIEAAFLEIPYIKLFLHQNPKGFTVTGRTYEIGGFAFVFQKHSPLADQVSAEILRLRESGALRRLEESLPSSRKTIIATASDSDVTDNDHDSLGLDEFMGLFLTTGSMSTLAMLLFFLGRTSRKWREGSSRRKNNSAQVQTTGPRGGLFTTRRNNRIHDEGEPDPAPRPPDAIERGDLRRCGTV